MRRERTPGKYLFSIGRPFERETPFMRFTPTHIITNNNNNSTSHPISSAAEPNFTPQFSFPMHRGKANFFSFFLSRVLTKRGCSQITFLQSPPKPTPSWTKASVWGLSVFVFRRLWALRVCEVWSGSKLPQKHPLPPSSSPQEVDELSPLPSGSHPRVMSEKFSRG